MVVSCRSLSSLPAGTNGRWEGNRQWAERCSIHWMISPLVWQLGHSIGRYLTHSTRYEVDSLRIISLLLLSNHPTCTVRNFAMQLQIPVYRRNANVRLLNGIEEIDYYIGIVYIFLYRVFLLSVFAHALGWLPLCKILCNSMPLILRILLYSISGFVRTRMAERGVQDRGLRRALKSIWK